MHGTCHESPSLGNTLMPRSEARGAPAFGPAALSCKADALRRTQSVLYKLTQSDASIAATDCLN